MNHKSSSAHARERRLLPLVERACRAWESRRQAVVQQAALLQTQTTFTIAIAREVGTQGTSVGHEVGRLLGWDVYDHELLEYIAKEMGLRTHSLESVDEKPQSWLEESVEAFPSPEQGAWRAPVSESSFVHHLVGAVRALGAGGECVIVGRGAAFILPAATTLRVRLIGSAAERLAVFRRNNGLSPRQAARKLRDMDDERIDFVREHFFKDATDPGNFDLVLNAPRLTVRQNAELIVEALHRLQVRRSETKK